MRPEEKRSGLVDPSRVADFLARETGVAPEVLLVLGSGLGALADAVDDPVSVPFTRAPGMPSGGVRGHAGRWSFGHLEGRPVLVQSGRFHYYEGWARGLVEAPVRIAARLGVGVAVMTNAAGGIGRGLETGSIMLVDDHLNLMSRSPLAGQVQEGQQRFPDMSAPYDRELQRIAMDAARELELPLARGTYAAVLGPCYETPAEVRMLARLGADAVGMSTVPEVIASRALGLRVAAFSLITNRATGLGRDDLSHDEVLEVGRAAAGPLEALVRSVVRGLSR